MDEFNLFQGWSSLGRTALSGVVAYAILVVFLRVSGKRTLSKMNAFDFVVTIAIGGTLSAILTTSTLPLADGVVALGLLVALQFLVAWLTVRARWFERLVKSQPVALVTDGRIHQNRMKHERISRDEIMMALRREGLGDVSAAQMVVLESDGSLTVLAGRHSSAPSHPTTADVQTDIVS